MLPRAAAHRDCQGRIANDVTVKDITGSDMTARDGNGGRAGAWRGAPVVVKLGGSLAFSDRLRDWIAAIAGCAGRAVVVPGGGPFADAVRAAQAKMGVADAAAHRMALLAMEQYGHALASLDARLEPADGVDAIRGTLRGGRVPVWLPARMALADAAIPQSWDVTSDSLAAWLAGRIGAGRLVLVKHVAAAAAAGGAAPPVVTRQTVAAAELAALEVVDRAFADFLAGSGVPATILGAGDCALLGAVVAGGRAGLAVAARGGLPAGLS
jgi:dihydroneopterin aldolase